MPTHPYYNEASKLFGNYGQDGRHQDPIYISNIEIDYRKVDTAIRALSTHAAPGPDGIPTSIYKLWGPAMVHFLVLLFKMSMEAGLVPINMKKALISPIFKGGDKGLASNYMPVALTTHLSKIFERVIRAQMVKYLEDNGVLDVTQHGSRPGRSTLSQLLEQYDTCLDLLLEGKNVDILYLDFSKAFDKVDLGLLLSKVHELGITGHLGRWIADFILGRTQAVKVGNKASTWDQVFSGVPQGSVLGPLMFLIFIGDLGTNITLDEAKILKYVDDTKLIKGVSSPDDVDSFQQTLQKVYNWQDLNNMVFNPDKFQLIRMGPNQLLKDETSLFTGDYDNMIEPATDIRDLGVQVDNLCTFEVHRMKAVQKTRDKAAWVLRTFSTRTPYLMKTLWKSLVLPHLDYCSQLWSGALNPVVTADLEGPQRAFTKRISGLYNLSYWDRLKELQLLSIERRFERYKILYTKNA